MADLFKKHWRFELVFLFSVVLCVGLLWMENRASSQTESDPLRSYGGRLSSDVRIVLGQMHSHLTNAKAILDARRDRVSFVDLDGQIRTYRFAHEAIWQDEKPVISNIRSFCFEFRDEWGNLLTRCENNSTSIETIGYTLCMDRNGNEIMVGSKLMVHKNAEGGNGNPAASADGP